MSQSSFTKPPVAKSEWWTCLLTLIAAFGAYFCVYAFRKPFTVGKYEAVGFADYNAILIASQTVGYALSKFIGIKVVSEVPPGRRVRMLLTVVAVAGLALLLFALTPAPFNLFWLFVNGLSLGVVFGFVLGFLEGRQQTELLTAGLCASFIIADGVTKSTGRYLQEVGVDDLWMPLAAALVFTPPLLLFCWMLTRVPPPSPRDIAMRSERMPLNRAERLALFWKFATGLTLLVAVFVLITILRSVRSDFTRQIWDGLEPINPPNADVFSTTEMIVAAVVLLFVGATFLIASHRAAFFVGLGIAALGIAILAFALVGLRMGFISSYFFMILMGIGLYLPYIVVHTTLLERLIAAARDRGNLGYLMYLADSFGYLGTVAVLLGKNFVATRKSDFLDFFIPMSWMIVIGCGVLLVPCWIAFARNPALQARNDHVDDRKSEANADRSFSLSESQRM